MGKRRGGVTRQESRRAVSTKPTAAESPRSSGDRELRHFLEKSLLGGACALRRVRLRTGAPEAAASALTSAAARFSRLRGRRVACQEGACGGIRAWETVSSVGKLLSVDSLPNADRDEP